MPPGGPWSINFITDAFYPYEPALAYLPAQNKTWFTSLITYVILLF